MLVLTGFRKARLRWAPRQQNSQFCGGSPGAPHPARVGGGKGGRGAEGHTEGKLGNLSSQSRCQEAEARGSPSEAGEGPAAGVRGDLECSQGSTSDEKGKGKWLPRSSSVSFQAIIHRD